MTSDAAPRWVYQHLNADGEPLYIGCTSDVEKRLLQHRYVSPWYRQIAAVKYFGPFPMREAREFEAAMIRELQPPHNYQYTEHNTTKPANRRQVREAPTPLRTRIGRSNVVHFYSQFGPDGKRLITGCGRVRPVDAERLIPDAEPVTCGRCIDTLSEAVVA